MDVGFQDESGSHPDVGKMTRLTRTGSCRFDIKANATAKNGHRLPEQAAVAEGFAKAKNSTGMMPTPVCAASLEVNIRRNLDGDCQSTGGGIRVEVFHSSFCRRNLCRVSYLRFSP